MQIVSITLTLVFFFGLPLLSGAGARFILPLFEDMTMLGEANACLKQMEVSEFGELEAWQRPILKARRHP